MQQVPRVEVYNHQSAINLPDELLNKYETLANQSVPLALQAATNGGGVLGALECVEISIVDDPAIAQVHVDFMDIPGATDVITFNHGEVVVSAETAKSQGEEYANTMEKELMLYIIHGLLHLAGHEDHDPEEREIMEKAQTEILSQVWV